MQHVMKPNHFLGGIEGSRDRGLSCSGSCTSNECLSDSSTCGDELAAGEGNPYKMFRRQYSFLPLLDVGISPDLSDRDSIGENSAAREVSGSGHSRCDSAMSETDLAQALNRSCLMKEKLSIMIPQSEYCIFPSDMPKKAIVECMQSIFDSISLLFHSRYDNDKHSWAVYSSIPDLATRFKIHVYDFDGITHVEMRSEAGCEAHARLVFCALQAAVGRHAPPTACEEADPIGVDHYLDNISDCVVHEEILTDRDMKRNLKSICRSIQLGSVSELEAACVSLMQAAVFESMHPLLVEIIPSLLERLIKDDVIKKMSEPVNPEISGGKPKSSLRSNRQRGYSMAPRTEWNAYVRASDVLRRLSANTECLDFILQNSCIVTLFFNFISSSLTQLKSFLFRRNMAIILDNLTAYKPSEVLMCGIKEAVCLQWLSADQDNCAASDPLFVKCVLKLMQNLGFSS